MKGRGLDGTGGVPQSTVRASADDPAKREGIASRLPARNALRCICNGFYKNDGLPVLLSGKKATNFPQHLHSDYLLCQKKIVPAQTNSHSLYTFHATPISRDKPLLLPALKILTTEILLLT
jgi:hypothetical protein